MIDAPDGVADRRHQLGGVGQGLAEHRPGVAAGPVGMGHQRAQAARLGGGDALGTGLDARAIGAGAEVDGLLDPRAVHLAQTVEAALALTADRALRDHLRDQGLLAAVGAQPVAGRQQPVHAGGHFRDQVDADQIEQPEHAGLGDAHRAAQHGVGLLDGQAQLDRPIDRRLQPVGADPVGDEARGILRAHHALAEAEIGEAGDRLQSLRPGRRAGDHLQQPHEARRIEEMGDQEVAPEALRLLPGEIGQRDGRGVRGDDAARPADGLQPPVERLLGRRLLDDRLDDPVDVGQGREVVLQVARGHQLGRIRGHERRRLCPEHPRDGAARERTPIAGPVRHDIEQQHRHAGIGDMRGDPAAHHPGTDHGGAPDLHGVRPLRARWRSPGRHRCTWSPAPAICRRAAAALPPCR